MTLQDLDGFSPTVRKLQARVAELEKQLEMQIAPGISVTTVSADSMLGKMLEKFEWMERRVTELEAENAALRVMEQVLSGTWCVAEIGWVVTVETMLPPDGELAQYHAHGDTLAAALIALAGELETPDA